MSKTIISTQHAPDAVGPYSQAVVAGGFVFTSGQLPVDPATGHHETKDIAKATQLALNNVEAVLKEADVTLKNVIKTTVFLSDMANFAAMNNVYKSYFTQEQPARSCVEVARLPLDAMVEIEVVAQK